MNIVVIGLGYVGTTLSACFARDGHDIVGVDVAPEKVAAFNAGVPLISEPYVPELLARGWQNGRVRAVIDPVEDIAVADVVVIAVGTPATPDGSPDLTALRRTVEAVGAGLAQRGHGLPRPLVVLRSTVPPGTTEVEIVDRLVGRYGLCPGVDFEAAFWPEFLREGTAVSDFDHPPKIVIGERSLGATEHLAGLVRLANDTDTSPCFQTSFRVAEYVKYADNAFHALKVGFANELGRVAMRYGVNPQDVADIFLADTKLNISAAYLRAGGAFGGSCLPKDVKALQALASAKDLRVPIISNILDSNAVHKEFLRDLIENEFANYRRILLIGLSFKAKTDDLRDSPFLELALDLYDAGHELEIYDPDVDLKRLTGANLSHVQRDRECVLESLMVDDLAEALRRCEAAIYAKPVPGFDPDAVSNPPSVDLHRLSA
jgi:GDP-mannose 6-dehydrogenase